MEQVTVRRIGRFLVQHRFWMWCVLIVLSAPPALGLWGKQLREGERDRWASAEDWAEMTEVDASFGFSGFPCALVIECEDFFVPERIAALQRAVRKLQDEDAVSAVIWVGRFPKLTWLGMRPILPENPLGQDELQKARAELLRHPLVVNQLLSPDGRTLLIPVVIGWDNNSLESVRTVAQRELVGAQMRVRLTGAAALWNANEIAQKEDHDRILYTAISLVVILALIIFRRPSAIIIACSGPALGVLWAEGWLRLLGMHRNELVEIILPVMLMMIGFTDGVHLVVDMRQRRAAGLDAAKASAESFGHVGVACLLTSITTAIGFGSLVIGKSEMIRGFGISSAIGVLVTFLAVVLVIPLLGCSWLGRRIHLGEQRDLVGRNLEHLSIFMDVVVRHARLIAGGGVLLTVVMLAAATRLDPDDRLRHRVPNNSEAYQALLHCEQTLGGIRFMQVLVEWPEETDIAQVWRVLQQTEDTLRNEPLISQPVSIRTWLEVLPGPDSPLKLWMGPRFLPELYRRQFWRPESRRAQIVVRIKDLGMAAYRPTLDRIERKFARLLQQYPGLRIELTGEAIVDSRVVGRNARELLHSLILAATIIFIVITAAFRSIRYGVISIVPNILPLAATAALRATIDTSLDIASACSFVICLGIAVDDTIHFLTRFRSERAAGHDVRSAIRRTFVTVGKALVMTTVVMMAGFASVMTSQLPTHWLFATMACATIAVALFADLIILPALLCCFPPGLPWRSTSAWRKW